MNSQKRGTIYYPHQAVLHEGTEKDDRVRSAGCPSDIQAPVLFTSSQSLLAQIPIEVMRDNEKADLTSGMYENKT